MCPPKGNIRSCGNIERFNEMNASLQKSILRLGILNEQRDQRKLKQWQEVSSRLGQLEKINSIKISKNYK